MPQDSAALKLEQSIAAVEQIEPSPESGKMEVIKAPESLIEVISKIKEAANDTTAEAKSTSAEMLSGEVYGGEKAAIDSATESAIQAASQRTEVLLSKLDKEWDVIAQGHATEAKVAAIGERVDDRLALEDSKKVESAEALAARVQKSLDMEERVDDMVDLENSKKEDKISARGERVDDRLALEDSKKAEEVQAHSAREARIAAMGERVDDRMALEDSKKEEKITAIGERVDDRLALEDSKIAEAAAEKKEPATFEGLTGKFDQVLAEYKQNGLKADAGLLRKMQKMMAEGSAENHANDPRYAAMGQMMGRMFSAMKGDTASWSSPRGESLEQDYEAMKQRESRIAAMGERVDDRLALEDSKKQETENEEVDTGEEEAIEAQETQEEPVVPAKVEVVEPELKAAEVAKVEEVKQEEQIKALDERVTKETVDGAKVDARVARMESYERDEKSLVRAELDADKNIKGREAILGKLYAVPPNKRTSEQQYQIDDLELSNNMERKTIEARRESLKLHGLEQRAAELEAQIAEAQAAEQVDALDVESKQSQLAEVMKSIGVSRVTIDKLEAAVAKLEDLRAHVKAKHETTRSKQIAAGGAIAYGSEASDMGHGAAGGTSAAEGGGKAAQKDQGKGLIDRADSFTSKLTQVMHDPDKLFTDSPKSGKEH